jgi:glycerol-3-phosphate acyltransferase PlsY
MDIVLFGSIAYLLGSIPSAVWIGKSWFEIDVREHGSKNSGATNTFRVLGKKAGITVLLMDVVKGLLAVLAPLICINFGFFEEGKWSDDELINIQLIAALAAVIGHVFPIFASFKGGKGVATSLGVIIGIHPPAAGLCFGLFFIVFVIFNYVSLGAICASIAFPLVLIFIFNISNIWLIIFSIFLSSAVIIAHRKNIGRLLKGEESKMKLFKSKSNTESK